MVKALTYLIDLIGGRPTTLMGPVFPTATDVATETERDAARVLESCARVAELIESAESDPLKNMPKVREATAAAQRCEEALVQLNADAPDLRRLLSSHASTDFLIPNMLTVGGAMCTGLQSRANLHDEPAFRDLKRLRKRLNARARDVVKRIAKTECPTVHVLDSDSNPVNFARASSLVGHMDSSDSDDVPTGIWVLLVVILVMFLLIVALLIALQVNGSTKNKSTPD